ncbi:hypothetical protein D3C84_1068300 [compost metagenome]
MQGLGTHGAVEGVVDQYRLAVAVADLAGEAGVAKHCGETRAVLIDIVEVTRAVAPQVGLEVEYRSLGVEARVVQSELGVVQRLGRIVHGHTVLATV